MNLNVFKMQLSAFLNPFLGRVLYDAPETWYTTSWVRPGTQPPPLRGVGVPSVSVGPRWKAIHLRPTTSLPLLLKMNFLTTFFYNFEPTPRGGAAVSGRDANGSPTFRV